MNGKRIAILGAGNIGQAIAGGLLASGQVEAGRITLTRRSRDLIEAWRERGCKVTSDNLEALRESDLLVLAVEPQQFDGLLAEIGGELDDGRHVLVSVVTGVSCAQIRAAVGGAVPIVRAMPNTAIAVRESITCLSGERDDGDAMKLATEVFDTLGSTIVIGEELMPAATALGACGVAFFLRAIRAASQGGIEIGFHAEEALAIAAQTARGAASLLLAAGNHPEREIDRVTTPRGCTIAGLNRMEHDGFSSAMIRGITVSAEMAAGLYRKDAQ